MAVLPPLWRCGLAALAVVLAACGDPFKGPAVTTGIQVSNETSGDPIEHDGYTVSVDAAPGRPLDVDGSILFSDLEPGDHSVELAGVEPDCEVLGVNPRTVHTTNGTAQSLFLVRCSVAGTGRVVVQTFTYGRGSDGYRIEIDGGRFAQLGTEDEFTFDAVPAGPVTLTLSGAVSGCEVAAPNPRTVQLHEHEELLSVFKVTCPA